MNIFYVGIGGFIGAILRYVSSKFVNDLMPFCVIPFGTAVVNIIGSFLLAFVMSYGYYRSQLNGHFILFFGTGLIGSFTTFSTMSYETLALATKYPLRGLIYLGVNLLTGFGAAFLGFIIGRGN